MRKKLQVLVIVCHFDVSTIISCWTHCVFFALSMCVCIPKVCESAFCKLNFGALGDRHELIKFWRVQKVNWWRSCSDQIWCGKEAYTSISPIEFYPVLVWRKLSL